MSYFNWNVLLSDNNWLGYFSTSSPHILTYSYKTALTNLPDYFYASGNPVNGFDPNYASIINAGTETSLTSEQQDVINYYLSASSGDHYRVSFSDVSNIGFLREESGGDLYFTNADVINSTSIASAFPPLSLFYDNFAGDIWFDNNQFLSINQGELSDFERGRWTVLHELAHSIAGLEHTTSLSGDYASIKYSIMAPEVSGYSHPDMSSNVYATQLQLYDIAAIQAIYGRNYEARDSNTTYSKITAFSTDRPDGAFIYTIWDGGGDDTIDASGYSDPVQIDLRQGRFSSIGTVGDLLSTAVAFDSATEDRGNLAIAYYTVVENAIGTAGNDTLIGNAWDNTLDGGQGDDILYGDGFAYDQTSEFLGWEEDSGNAKYALDLSGNDILFGRAGNDILHASPGRDYLDGGDDLDTLVIANVAAHEKGIQIGGAFNAPSEYDYAKDIEIFELHNSGTYLKIYELGNTYRVNPENAAIFDYSEYSSGLVFNLANKTISDGGSVSDSIMTHDGGVTGSVTFIGTDHGDTYTMSISSSVVGRKIINSGIYDDIFDLSGEYSIDFPAFSNTQIYYNGGDDILKDGNVVFYLPDNVDVTDVSFSLSNSRPTGLPDIYIADVIATIDGYETIKLEDFIQYEQDGLQRTTESIEYVYFAFRTETGTEYYKPNYSKYGVFSSVETLTSANSGVEVGHIEYHDFSGKNLFNFSVYNAEDYHGYDGDDVVYFAGNSEYKTVYGGTGNDKVVFDANLNDYTLVMHVDGMISAYGPGEGVFAYGTEQFQFQDYLVTIDDIRGTGNKRLVYGSTSSGEIINGNSKDDFIFAYEGNDVINGAEGNNVLWGGGGADIFEFSDLGDIGEYSTIKDFDIVSNDQIDLQPLLEKFNPAKNILSEFIEVTSSSGNTIISVDLDGNGGSYSIQQIALIDNVSFSTNVSQLVHDGILRVPYLPSDVNYAYGTYLNDLALDGSINADIISGLSGNDIISGLDGNDTVYAGDGDDELYGNNGNDVLIGGAGEDDYWGGSGADTLVFTQEELLNSTYDKIWDFNPYEGDKVDLTALWQNYSAGNGIIKDFIQLTNSNGNTYLNIDYDGLGSAYTMTNVAAVMGVNAGTNPVALINYGYITIPNSYFGTNGDDSLDGSQNNDVLFGRDGHDLIFGDNGSDAIYGGYGNDHVSGGAGHDILYGEDGNDALWGGVGNDRLYGWGGADTFYFDTTQSSQGNDLIGDFDAVEGDLVHIVLPAFDPVNDAITDFIEITTSGSNSLLKVDTDGGGDNFVQIAVIGGITGITDEQFLYDNGYLSIN